MAMITQYIPHMEVASDAEDLADHAVRLFVSAARDAVGSRGSFRVAISGGRTPQRFFERLAETPDARSLDWQSVHVFWVDERYVPLDSPDSNYKLAADGFLSKVDIPEENVHQIPTEYEDLKIAARRYEETIRTVFGLRRGELPEFDLIVLGMGEDGHTGSLFPNSYAPFDSEDLACAVYVMDGKHNRITLTHPVLLAARHLVVLVSGREKASTLKDVLTSEPDEVRFPIHVLWPAMDKTTWLVDRTAASEIL
jgi:6-phosphogluconolactonase